jgi:hypothetical protein
VAGTPPFWSETVAIDLGFVCLSFIIKKRYDKFIDIIERRNIEVKKLEKIVCNLKELGTTISKEKDSSD